MVTSSVVNLVTRSGGSMTHDSRQSPETEYVDTEQWAGQQHIHITWQVGEHWHAATSPHHQLYHSPSWHHLTTLWHYRPFLQHLLMSSTENMMTAMALTSLVTLNLDIMNHNRMELNSNLWLTNYLIK